LGEKLAEKINSLRDWQTAIVITVMGFITYFSGLNNPFEGDDFGQIVNNPVVHSISHVKLLFEGGTFYNGGGIAPLTGLYFRPLGPTVYALLYTLFGPNTLPYHLLQLLLCIGSTVLLYLVFKHTFNALLSLLLAMVFLIHPLDSQIVYAIPNMQDALFFFFGILSVYLLLRYRSIRSLSLVVVFLFLSLLAKETAVCFIAVALLYLFWFDRKRLLPLIYMLIVPLALYGVLRVHAIGIGPSPVNSGGPIGRADLAARLMTAPSIMQFYLAKLIFPWKLATGYYWIYSHFSVTHVLIPLIIDLATITLVVWMAFFLRGRVNKAHYFTYWFFAIWAALGIATCLQIIPLDMTVCESWFYFSMAGMLGMVGIVIIAFQKYINPSWFLTIAALLIVLLGTRTLVRGYDYSSQYKLSMQSVADSPQDWVAYNQLAGILIAQGNYRQAVIDAQRSVDIFPTFINSLNLGDALFDEGNYAGAYRAYIAGPRYGNYYELWDSLAVLTLVYGTYQQDTHILDYTLSHFSQDDSLIWTYAAILEQRHGNNAAAKIDITQAAAYGQVSPALYGNIMDNRPFTLRVARIPSPIQVP
jgi:hypothetical protein